VQQKTSYFIWFGIVVIAVVALSQFIGLLINTNIPERTTIELNSLIHFTHVRNHGGIFGLLQGKGWLFAIISTLLLGAVVVYLYRGKDIQRYEYICFGFIVGGGISNVLDRLLYGSVIDFIDLQHIPYWNYVFNTADLMVHLGIWPMLFFSFFFSPASNQNVGT
jgi:signal peptidase II